MGNPWVYEHNSTGNERGWIVEGHESVNMELRLGLKFAAAFADKPALSLKMQAMVDLAKLCCARFVAASASRR
jgi:hypothetical protein